MLTLFRSLRDVVGSDIWCLYRNSITAALVGIVAECAAYAAAVPLLATLLDDRRSEAQRWILALAGLLVVIVLAREVQRRHTGLSTFSATPLLLQKLVAKADKIPSDWWTSERRAEFVHMVFPGSALINPVNAAVEAIRSTAIPMTVWVVVLIVDWRPAVVMLALLPILWWIHSITTRMQQQNHAQDAAVDLEIQSRIAEFADLQGPIRTSGSARGARRLLDEALAELRLKGDRTVVRELGSLVAMKSAVNTATATVVAAVAWAWTQSELSGALAAAIAVLAVRFFDPLVDAGSNIRSMRTTLQGARKLAALMEAPELTVPEAAQSISSQDQSRIDVVDASFRHRNAPTDTLTRIMLEIPAQSFTAIVGPTGAGKSTLISILQRMFDVNEGIVTIGGIDIREYELTELSSAIGYVPQNGHLSKGTLESNVRLGNPTASGSELNSAAALVALDEVVDRLPDGWRTSVGQFGSGLSGGERQRVHLARVTLQDPPIIVLDEATSALDPVTEGIVVRWIESQRGRRTIVVVAHNLHTIIGADQIVVLEQGRVVQRGTHRELVKSHGTYRNLWESRRPSQEQ